jgi:hypothetical protein
MLVNPDNVLPIDGAGRNSAGADATTAGRNIGSILMDEGKLTAADAGRCWRASAARLALREATRRAEPDQRRGPRRARQAVRVPYLVSAPRA